MVCQNREAMQCSMDVSPNIYPCLIPGGYCQEGEQPIAGWLSPHAGDTKLLMRKLPLYLNMNTALQSHSHDFIASRLPPYTGDEPLGPQGGPIIMTCDNRTRLANNAAALLGHVI